MEVESQDQQEPPKIINEELTTALRTALLAQQDIVYALIGGFAAAVIGGVLWAIITVATNHQIGYMAIAVGFLAGIAVRIFGAGIDRYYAFIGAFFALLGCALGNLFSQIGFIANSESISYLETISLLNFDVIAEIYTSSFSPIDILFYAIAAYEGYRFSVRSIDDEMTQAIELGSVPAPVFAKYRLPVVIILVLILAAGAFWISNSSSGIRVYNYESGSKRSSGEMSHGKENGPWQTWWENGNQQSTGFYKDGEPDSLWTYFSENGELFRKGHFHAGMQHGEWIDYYPGGAVTSKGKYNHDRLDDVWVFYFQNGKISSTGKYVLDSKEGVWETFYENGKTSTKGNFTKGTATGPWTYWHESGAKSSDMDFGNDGKIKIINTWTAEGKPEIVNGNGQLKLLVSGQVISTGMIKDGEKVGPWTNYYDDGSKQDESEYRSGKMYLINSWYPDRTPMVRNGEGKFELKYDSIVSEAGTIHEGLREGQWMTYYPGGDSVQTRSTYKKGTLNGSYKGYSVDGNVIAEGDYENDRQSGEWRWYHSNNALESTVVFKNGKKEGDQFLYNSSGKLLKKEVYQNGELKSVSIESD